MQQDPAFVKMVQKSFILKRKQNFQKLQFPSIKKEQKIKHRIYTNFFFSSIIHLLFYPLETVKTRIISRSNLHDVAHFELNKVSQLSLYAGFLKGYSSILIGNFCYTALKQINFLAGVAGQAFFKLFIDVSKINAQMGNAKMNINIFKSVFPSLYLASFTRDLAYRFTNQQIFTTYLQYIKYNKQDNFIHARYLSCIIATLISHPLDVIYTKLASQQSLHYTGFFNAIQKILQEDMQRKFLSGFAFRLIYNFIGVQIGSMFYKQVENIALQIV